MEVKMEVKMDDSFLVDNCIVQHEVLYFLLAKPV